MKASSKEKVLSPVQIQPITVPIDPSFDRTRTLRYIGSVTRATNEQLLTKMEKMLDKSSTPLTLFVTCSGGATGTAISFYDSVRHILKPDLITVGSGDVDSSGILIFLTGEKRYVTAHTTLLFHPAGRFFDNNQRYTTLEMEAMLAEDRLKDEQYASLVAERSHGKLSTKEVLGLMATHTVVSPSELVELGLADAVIS